MVRQFKFDHIPFVILALLLLLIIFSGCGVTRKNGSDGHQIKEVTKETPTADGGKVIEKTVTYQGQQEEIERTEADPAFAGVVNSIAPFAGAAISAATGTPGLPWAELISGVATTAALGWGALKHGQNGGLKEQVEFHKADAADAYRQLNESAP